MLKTFVFLLAFGWCAMALSHGEQDQSRPFFRPSEALPALPPPEKSSKTEPRRTENPYYDEQLANDKKRRDAEAVTLEQRYELEPNGDYDYFYVTSNRIVAKQQGRNEKLNNEKGDNVLRVVGFYQYLAPDGMNYRVDYVADENGYRVLKNNV